MPSSQEQMTRFEEFFKNFDSFGVSEYYRKIKKQFSIVLKKLLILNKIKL